MAHRVLLVEPGLGNLAVFRPGCRAHHVPPSRPGDDSPAVALLRKAAFALIVFGVVTAVSWAHAATESSHRRLWVEAWASASLLLGGCTTLGWMQTKSRRQARLRDERMAAALAAALQRGAIDFNIVRGAGILRLAGEPDETDLEDVQLMPTRYRLLGHPGRQQDIVRPEALELPRVRVRLVGAVEPGVTGSCDVDGGQLLLGVPKALLFADPPADGLDALGVGTPQGGTDE